MSLQKKFHGKKCPPSLVARKTPKTQTDVMKDYIFYAFFLKKIVWIFKNAFNRKKKPTYLLTSLRNRKS